MSNFSFFITLLILHVETYVIPLWKADLVVFFLFLQLRPLCNLWRHFDNKTEIMLMFCL